MSYNIECVLMCENYLGEGPVWDVEEGCIYWVDGTGHRVGKPCIWRLDPKTGKVDNWSLDHDVGAMALRKAQHKSCRTVLATSRWTTPYCPTYCSPLSRAARQKDN